MNNLTAWMIGIGIPLVMLLIAAKEAEERAEEADALGRPKEASR